MARLSATRTLRAILRTLLLSCTTSSEPCRPRCINRTWRISIWDISLLTCGNVHVNERAKVANERTRRGAGKNVTTSGSDGCVERTRRKAGLRASAAPGSALNVPTTYTPNNLASLTHVPVAHTPRLAHVPVAHTHRYPNAHSPLNSTVQPIILLLRARMHAYKASMQYVRCAPKRTFF